MLSMFVVVAVERGLVVIFPAEKARVATPF